jgi:hypothetical protein
VGRHAGQEHHAAVQVEEEQHIGPPEHDRVGVKEVARAGSPGPSAGRGRLRSPQGRLWRNGRDEGRSTSELRGPGASATGSLA